MVASGKLVTIRHLRRQQETKMRAKEFTLNEGIKDWLLGKPKNYPKPYGFDVYKDDAGKFWQTYDKIYADQTASLDRMEKVINSVRGQTSDDVYIKASNLFRSAVNSMPGKSIEDKSKIEQEFYNELKQLGIKNTA